MISLHHLYLEDAFILSLCTCIYASKEGTMVLRPNQRILEVLMFESFCEMEVDPRECEK